MIGKSLRSYRVESKLGAGGMGVVYKAVDARLGRAVAIKVLSSAALNADRERRFAQEAKAASSLNHPNIVTIYDIDTQEVDGKPVQYIAMEFVAGETLDHLIGRKGLRIRDVLKYAIQIADALAAAHAAGIVHRDLKPSNVIVTAQGLVKVLDFGLAKLNESGNADAYAETMHGDGSPLTEEGTILGTVAYMSPEQADGKNVDRRSDIFSFGSVLYEMATGQRAFAGGSKLSSLSAVMYKDPQPASQSVADVPPELDRIIARCLKKDPSRRWQTMADVKVALEELQDEMESSNFAVSAPVQSARGTSRTKAWTGLGLLAGVLLGAALAASYEQRYSRPVEPPSFQRLTFRRGDVTSAKFAPGDNVVYSAEWDGEPSTLFAAQPGIRESRPLSLPPARVLAISPKGEMAILLGGEDTGTLARVAFGGGAPRPVLENVSGADWGPDGESLAVVRTVGGKYRLEYPVGTVLYENEKRPPQMPRVSADGKLVAFFDFDMEVGDYALCIVGANHPRQVLSRGWRAIGALNWSPDSREVWFSGGQPGGDPALYAVTLSGQQRLVTQTGGIIVMQDVARDGRVLLSTVNSRLGISFLAPNGTARDLAWLDSSLMYDLSNDGKSMVFVELSNGQGRNSAIYLRKTDGSPAIQLGYGNRPSLSPDGKWVACIHHDADKSSLMLLPTGPGESLFPKIDGIHFDGVEWFADNKHILFTGNESGHPTRTWTYDLEASRATPLTPEGTRGTLVSPDGKWFITVNPQKLLLASVAGGAPAEAIAELQPGESAVRWSGDGRYLFLQKRDAASIQISRVEVASRRREPWLSIKVPEPGAQFLGPLALSADGKACATTFQRDLANLFLVRGLK
ncbi:MAG TPA: protein kinase [Candidatus Sulfotelmatobacter sp.]|jgi:serine/threonine protein kinase/dipeptidyl aminopeptidase/acylaminoacyl peptidase